LGRSLVKDFKLLIAYIIGIVNSFIVIFDFKLITVRRLIVAGRFINAIKFLVTKGIILLSKSYFADYIHVPLSQFLPFII